MPKIETPRNFADTIWAAIDENWGDAEACYKAMTALIATRDTAIRAECAELLKMCGEALEQIASDDYMFSIHEIARVALAALGEAGVKV